jgi:hypothetical protein
MQRQDTLTEVVTERRWLGAVEGYYGPPLSHPDRIELVEWMGAHGFNAYGYAPKDDPYHRERWREPYPADREAHFSELVAAGTAAGVDVALVISPGLDWAGAQDDDALARKLESFIAHGARTLGIAWDDVPAGGAALGATHARAVASAVTRLGPDVRWVTCPTDYATDRATSYLRAYCDGLPPDVDVMWTGPSIVSPRLEGGLARTLGDELGRPLLIADNYPVNDGAMAGVLHLGPYRGRDAELPAATTGVFFNFMARAHASRLALACGAAFWRDPSTDPEQTWRSLLAGEFDSLAPLARASRTWALDAAPDVELAAWVDAAIGGDVSLLNAYLDAGCRDGLDPRLASEVEPWLAAWEAERLAMQCAIWCLVSPPEQRASWAFATAETWARARFMREQTFGVRWVHYPLTTRDGDDLVALPEGVLQAENLTDRLARAALSAT